MKFIPKDKLILRESRAMFYGGGEIWVEDLDALSIHKDILLSKLQEDMKKICKPSAPSLVAVNLSETLVDEEVAEVFAKELCGGGEFIRKVVFVGLRGRRKALVRRALRARERPPAFVYTFENDYEKAKQWLMDKKKRRFLR